MNDLGFAHAGYGYQDLVTAAAAVNLILRQTVEVVVDTKVVGAGDVLDDMTIRYADGPRKRRQIKHQQTQQPLAVDTFVRDRRDLRLDMLVRSAKADREAFPTDADCTTFHIYLRDSPSEDETLLAVLHPADPDPGPLFDGSDTQRFTFDADKIWQGVHRPGAGSRAAGDAFESPPIGPGLSAYQWFEPVGMSIEVFDGVSIPLVCQGKYDNEYVDDCEGQGLPSDMVVPSPVLVELFGLQPTGNLVLTDESGPQISGTLGGCRS